MCCSWWRWLRNLDGTYREADMDQKLLDEFGDPALAEVIRILRAGADPVESAWAARADRVAAWDAVRVGQDDRVARLAAWAAASEVAPPQVLLTDVLDHLHDLIGDLDRWDMYVAGTGVEEYAQPQHCRAGDWIKAEDVDALVAKLEKALAEC
jgi:hypothetical protein